mgnify:CR=1 FL=1
MIKLIPVILILLSSCSVFKSKKLSLSNDSAEFTQKEEQGEFITLRESGFNKAKEFIVKSSTKSDEEKSLSIEKGITFSKVHTIGKRISGLIPVRSEVIYYLNGQKYLSQFSYNIEDRSILVRMESPEGQWNGEKSFSLPKGNGNICYYSTVIECAIKTGFAKKSIRNGGGKMNFFLIWEGYPYFHEQFINVPGRPFSKASLTYDGTNKYGEHRFTLDAGGQNQFYFVDKSFKIKKHIWASQGFTRERK